jgi:hypothetical protein
VRTKARLRGVRAATLGAMIAVAVCAANAEDEPPLTRMEQMRRDAERRVQDLKPDEPDRTEQLVDKVLETATDRIFGGLPGLRIKMGGLPTGSGFALGPEYYRPDLRRGQMTFRASAVASARQFYLIDIGLSLPYLVGRRFAVDLYARRGDFPSIDYYGPGPDSRKEGRSDYRLEDTALGGRIGWRPARRRLLAGFEGGGRFLNVGPGQDRRFVSSDAIFGSAVSPGIDRQANYLTGGPFLELDLRDHPGVPHQGLFAAVRQTWFQDRTFQAYSFRRFSAEAQHYTSFFNGKRVIAIRARTDLSYRSGGGAVPFYLQPTLGGSDDLRGFRRFRFYDNNLLLGNAEYRWEVSPMFDMALFADAGKVFNRLRQFNLARLESSYGFGMRFKTRDAYVTRIDVGFSREGFQVWFKFDDIYSARR